MHVNAGQLNERLQKALSTGVRKCAMKAEDVLSWYFWAVFLLFSGLNELGISLFFFLTNTYNVLFPSLFLSKVTLQMGRVANMKSNCLGAASSIGLPCRICWFRNRPQVAFDGPVPKSPWLFNAIWLLRSLGPFWGPHPAPASSCHAAAVVSPANLPPH